MATPLIDLAGQRLLVIGAGAGIGASCLDLARAAGAQVAASVMPGEAAEAEHVSVADVTDQAAVENAVDNAATALGGLDAVILTAGIFEHRNIDDTDAATWRRVLAINLDGPYHVARAALPHLKPTKGSLVFFSSQVAQAGHPRATAYAASKAGVEGLTRTLAIEVAAFGARVNAVAPGPIETGMTAIARADATRRASLLAGIPLGRFGQADEVARAALYLASPQSAFLTGQVLTIDGGFTAQ